MTQKPRLLQGGLTGRIYVTTRYRELDTGAIVADEKVDVTADFKRIEAERAEVKS